MFIRKSLKSALVCFALSSLVTPVLAETTGTTPATAAAPVVAVIDQATTQNTSQTTTYLTNINTADAPTLALVMNGIGMKKAEAIVAYRDANGPFKSVDDLALVKGVGAATVKKNAAILTVE